MLINSPRKKYEPGSRALQSYIRRGGVSHELTWLFSLTSLGGWSQGFALLKCLLEKGHGQDDPYSEFQ